MSDVLIRDIPEEVLAGVDAHASRLGLSRSEYIRRRLAQDAAAVGAPVSVDDLKGFAASFADRVVFLADGRVVADRTRMDASEIASFMLSIEQVA